MQDRSSSVPHALVDWGVPWARVPAVGELLLSLGVFSDHSTTPRRWLSREAYLVGLYLASAVDSPGDINHQLLIIWNPHTLSHCLLWAASSAGDKAAVGRARRSMKCRDWLLRAFVTAPSRVGVVQLSIMLFPISLPKTWQPGNQTERIEALRETRAFRAR